MSHSLSFNDIDLGNYGLIVRGSIAPVFPSAKVSTSSVARSDGGFAPSSTFDVKEIPVQAILKCSSLSQAQANLDSVAYILSSREDCNLVFDCQTDRYYQARCKEVDPTFISPEAVDLSITFILHDPFAYNATSTVETDGISDTNGETFTFSSPTYMTAYPEIELTANASCSTITVEDEVGNALSWSGSLSSGDTLKITSDPRYYLVEKKPSGGEYSEDMSSVSGRFPTISNGSNGYTFTGFSGSVEITYRTRFL